MAVLLVTPGACAAPTAIEGPARIGQMAYVGGPRVLPERVIEDSRCPAGTACIWPGRVVLRATVYGGAWTKPVDLVLGVPVDIADGKLTLVAVTPARGVSQPTRFTFAFQGGL